MRQIGTALVLLLAALGISSAREHALKQSRAPDALQLTADAINAAALANSVPLDKLSPELTVKLQVMLDRAHFSPGEIDAQIGENTIKAFDAFERESGLPESHSITRDIWARLSDLGRQAGSALEARPLLSETRPARENGRMEGEGQSRAEDSPDSSSAAAITVSISRPDVKGPFTGAIPTRMEEQARLKRLSYTSPLQELGERYHTSPKLLKTLNPAASFDKEGQEIWVPNIHSNRPGAETTSVAVDKRWATVTVYDGQKRVLAVYPATVGSAEKPSLSGDTKVERVVYNPWYTFDPSVLHFKDVKARGVFKIAPGPNNPTGLVWIALAKGEGYGIHGAGNPDKVSKTASHGCVRLTNWDALELASMVRAGTPIEFVGGEENAERKDTGRRSRRATQHN